MSKRKSPDSIHQEYKYLTVLQDILDNGEASDDRTGIGTIKTFSQFIKFDISQEFPLLTTKKMGVKSIITELLWFLKGNTDVTWLQDRKCNIWNANSSDLKYLEASGNKEFDAGKNYSWQLRNYNGTNLPEDKPNGVDQLAYVINLIKTNPTSRRILFNYWNPQQISLVDVCLPPCHILYVFQVDVKRNKLNCALTMRSSDYFLGVPYNLTSLATLVMIICHVTGYNPGQISINMVDCHLYKNHIEQAKEQLSREPMEFPQMSITKPFDKTEDPIKFIESLTHVDFKLVGYKSHKRIKAPMAV